MAQDPGDSRQQAIDSAANSPSPAAVGSMLTTERSSEKTQKQDHDKSVAAQKASKAHTLYRRPLPSRCIDFASQEGKKIFKEAMYTDHMNCYFRLAAQFRTQDEPAYCGLASLVMVLNALEIDPGRVWKGPWKWYHEDMLDCCVSTELVRKEGITFDDFICLAECNYLETQAVRIDQSSNEEEFRRLVREVTQLENTFLVVSYSRPVLGQTGDGHFAPVSGYYPEKDLVLILDTARFKYPPHWISLPLLFESMKALDRSTGLPRGHIQVWPRKGMKALMLFKIAEQFGVNASEKTVENYQSFLSMWMQLLASLLPKDSKVDGSSSVGGEGSDADAQCSALLASVLQGLVKAAQHLKSESYVLQTQEHVSCTKACDVQCVVQELLIQLEATATFKAVCEKVVHLTSEDLVKLENVFGVWPSVGVKVKAEVKLCKVKSESCGSLASSSGCDMNNALCLCHFITAFLLSWPYSLSPVHTMSAAGSLGSALQKLSLHDLSQSQRNLLSDEISTLNHQLSKLTGYLSPASLSPAEMHKSCHCSSFPKFNS